MTTQMNFERLIDNPKFRIRDRELRQLSTRWERSTAYGCKVRGKEFDPEVEALFREHWFAEWDKGFEV